MLGRVSVAPEERQRTRGQKCRKRGSFGLLGSAVVSDSQPRRSERNIGKALRPSPGSDDEDRAALKKVCFSRFVLLRRRSDLVNGRTKAL
jgi:hypothetical protein